MIVLQRLEIQEGVGVVLFRIITVGLIIFVLSKRHFQNIKNSHAVNKKTKQNKKKPKNKTNKKTTEKQKQKKSKKQQQQKPTKIKKHKYTNFISVEVLLPEKND